MLRLNGKKLMYDVVLHTNFFSKGTGLMFHTKITKEAHIFIFKKPKLIGITMMFVFFPIDLLFLSEKNKVVEMKQGLKPFSEFVPKKRALYVVELPEHAIRKNKIKIDDCIEF